MLSKTPYLPAAQLSANPTVPDVSKSNLYVNKKVVFPCGLKAVYLFLTVDKIVFIWFQKALIYKSVRFVHNWNDGIIPCGLPGE